MSVELSQKKYLVVGCGGIGCEVIKLLILKQIKNITLIDFDTIEITNLNRQFFFTEKDIGKSKVEVTKKIYERMVPGCNVESYNCSIIDKKFDLDFFKQFDLVLNCLDNVKTRSYVNLRCKLLNLPLIDGGTAGFNGQSMIFHKKECYDCLPRTTQKIVPICTIRGKPTDFTHCVAYGKDIVLPALVEKLQTEEKLVEFLFSNQEDLEGENSKEEKDLIADLEERENDDEKDSKSGNNSPQQRKSDDFIDKFDSNSKIHHKSTQEALKEALFYFKQLKLANFPVFNKDNPEIFNFIYHISCIRADLFDIDRYSKFEAEKIIKSIVPSVCTTNSIVASLMIHSMDVFNSQTLLDCNLDRENSETADPKVKNSPFNYFLTRSKKLISKQTVASSNTECPTCTQWHILNLSEDLLDPKELIDELGMFNPKILVNDTILDNKVAHKIEHNTIMEVMGDDEILKFYVQTGKNEFSIEEVALD